MPTSSRPFLLGGREMPGVTPGGKGGAFSRHGVHLHVPRPARPQALQAPKTRQPGCWRRRFRAKGRGESHASPLDCGGHAGSPSDLEEGPLGPSLPGPITFCSVVSTSSPEAAWAAFPRLCRLCRPGRVLSPPPACSLGP